MSNISVYVKKKNLAHYKSECRRLRSKLYKAKKRIEMLTKQNDSIVTEVSKIDAIEVLGQELTMFSQSLMASEKINKTLTKNEVFDLILNVVANHYNMKRDYVLSNSRKEERVLARHLIMYYIVEIYDNDACEFTLKEVGNFMGGRDHSTVIHGVARVKDDISVSRSLKKEYDIVFEKINQAL